MLSIIKVKTYLCLEKIEMVSEFVLRVIFANRMETNELQLVHSVNDNITVFVIFPITVVFPITQYGRPIVKFNHIFADEAVFELVCLITIGLFVGSVQSSLVVDLDVPNGDSWFLFYLSYVYV